MGLLFSGSELHFSFSGTWSDSMHKIHKALQELKTVALMLHRMVFDLFCKVVALHLDKSTANAYLCNQGGTVCPFFFLY